MKAEYLTTINQFQRLAIISAKGPVTPRGFYDAHEKLRQLPDWRHDLDLLVVLQPGVSLEFVNFSDISLHSDLFRSWNSTYRTGKNPKTAVVTASNIFTAACTFWAALRRDDWRVDVSFHPNELSAMRWIQSRREERAQVGLVAG